MPMLKQQEAPTVIPELRPSEFEMIRDLALKTFGLDLRAGKERLVASRLGKHLRDGGFRSFRQYYDRVRTDTSGDLLIGLIDALTTNHTSFLREPAHFDYLRELLSTEYRLRSRIDIWSAASATGEEPYTLLFTALSCPDRGMFPDVHILASDISTRALSVAKKGMYSRERIATLPGAWTSRFFESAGGPTQEFRQVKAEFRARIAFRRINLIESLPVNTVFPVIFCRNVMIYFNKSTQAELVDRLAAKLEPGGYLFVGHSESLSGIDHSLRYVRPAVYQKQA
jgi:chemotaxis protein methyltransferase CheR